MLEGSLVLIDCPTSSVLLTFQMRHDYLASSPAHPNLPLFLAGLARSLSATLVELLVLSSGAEAPLPLCSVGSPRYPLDWAQLSKGTMNCSQANGSYLMKSQNPTDQLVQLLPRLLLHLCKTTILMLEAGRCCGRSFLYGNAASSTMEICLLGGQT